MCYIKYRAKQKLTIGNKKSKRIGKKVRTHQYCLLSVPKIRGKSYGGQGGQLQKGSKSFCHAPMSALWWSIELESNGFLLKAPCMNIYQCHFISAPLKQVIVGILYIDNRCELEHHCKAVFKGQLFVTSMYDIIPQKCFCFK